MSAVLERKQAFEAVNYFDHRTVGANVVRWVFNPLDLIVPQRKSELTWMENGGEEVPSSCLRRFGNNFIPRGLPAILELGGEPIPMQHLGELQSSAWAGMPLNDHAVKNKFGYVPVYPGHGLSILRRYSMNDIRAGGIRKGIDEVESLRGKTYEECYNGDNYCDSCMVSYPPSVSTCPQLECSKPLTKVRGNGILDVITEAAFGDGMSKTLSGLEDQIRYAKVTDTRIDFGRYQAETIRMCGEAKTWAGVILSFEHGLLKAGRAGDWTYSYSPVGELLLEQLDIPRQDQPLQEMAKMIGGVLPQQQQGMSANDLNLIEQRMQAMQAQMAADFEQRLALANAALQSENEELKQRIAQSEPKEYLCSGCQQSFDSPQGKSMHERLHCKVLNPETEQE